MSKVRRTWTVENIWACTYCRASNRGRSLSCVKCGASKGIEVVDEVPKDGPEVTDPDPGVLISSPPDLSSPSREDDTEVESPRSRRLARGTERPVFPKDDIPLWEKRTPVFGLRVWHLVAITAAAALLVWLIVWIATPREVNATVHRTSWNYVENLRAREVRHGGGWGHAGRKDIKIVKTPRAEATP